MTTNNRKQFHERLWSAAVQLRANSGLKLNEISEPILGLIFLKFADVRFKRAKAEIEVERNKNKHGRQAPLSPDHYKSKGVLFLPGIAIYSYLMNLPGSENIGKAINEAMKEIEEKNTDLAGVLPQDFTSLHKIPGENSQILITLLKNFNQIPDDIEGDAFGEIYEYFLGEFARAEGAKGGEFFTPQSIVKLLVEIIEPYSGKILDPACGSGGMFVQSANFVKSHSNKKSQVMNEVALYGQEKVSSNIRIAKMNLAIHGLSGKIAEVNSFYTDAFKSVGTFDFVLANPPFNAEWNPERLSDKDPRTSYGLPPKGNANFLWIQHFIHHLTPNGTAGFVMANGALAVSGKEGEIRKKMIEDDLVEVVIACPPKLFFNVTLPVSLWFVTKNKQSGKYRNRKGETLFIDARETFHQISRKQVEFTQEQIEKISGTVRSWREGKNYKDIAGFCKASNLDEIIKNGYVLTPGRFVGIPEEVDDGIPFETKMKQYSEDLNRYFDESKKLEAEIKNNLKLIKS